MDKGYSFSGKIYNLSLKGMYVQTDAPLALGELFRADIIRSRELREGESMIGAVVWYHTLRDANTGRFGYGVQYFRVPPSALLLSSKRDATFAALPSGLGWTAVRSGHARWPAGDVFRALRVVTGLAVPEF